VGDATQGTRKSQYGRDGLPWCIIIDSKMVHLIFGSK
jgi:hypothetical protein